jgi:hypothetical protein
VKNSRSPYVIVGAVLASATFAVAAQTPPAEPPKKDEKKAVAKKPPPKAPVAKKAEAKKTDAKKPAAAPKKPVEIKTMNTDKPLVLRDKEGNVIPTTPDAYNVDSALPRKR